MPSKPASWAARATPVSQPCRVLAPGEPGQLQHHARAVAAVRRRRAPAGRPPGPAPVGRRVARRSTRSAARPVPTATTSGPSPRRPARPARDRAMRLSCPVSAAAGTGRSRARLRARQTSAGRVEPDDDRRQARAARASAARPGAVPGRGRGCRRPWSARGRPGPRPPCRAGRTRRPRRPGRAARCRRRRAGRRRRRSRWPGSARPPRSDLPGPGRPDQHDQRRVREPIGPGQVRHPGILAAPPPARRVRRNRNFCP